MSSGRAVRAHDDAGQVAGFETVPFGLLVLTVGILVIAHAWAVVDAKFVTATAAREATRGFVEAPSAAEGMAEARRAARAVTEQSGRDAGSLTLRRTGTGFHRCLPVALEAGLRVPAVGVPWRPDRASVEVTSRHREVVDPYRDGLTGLARCDRAP